MTDGDYRHLYVVMEQEEGKIVPVSLEMLSEARRLMDDFNKKYSSDEKVVALLLGDGVKEISKVLIEHGADVVIVSDNQELRYVRNTIYTKLIAQIATDKEVAAKVESVDSASFKKPRYMFFAADSVGRHLSSTVMAELDSGLASDINKLVVEDLQLTHQIKTAGKPLTYEKTLEMYRPDFSGFLWTTILCLDNRNPSIERDYHPQACSIIPGVFEPIESDSKRSGKIIEYLPRFEEKDLLVKILDRKIIKNEIDFDARRTIVGFGRGIKDAPEQNVKLIEQLASELEAEIGVSLPLSKKIISINQSIDSKYFIADRVIGSSGRKVSPKLYIAVGISGAIQHLAGMKDSEFILAINPDEDSPIKDECDIFIKGRMEDVIPMLIENLKTQKKVVQA
ncbi:MAG: electron transfer flavoprotein subunit alpha/FixB family protein [Nitrosotalea sp.]